MAYFHEHLKRTSGQYHRFSVQSVHSYSKLKAQVETQCQDPLNDWLTGMEEARNKKFTLLPVNASSNHWVLLVIVKPGYPPSTVEKTGPRLIGRAGRSKYEAQKNFTVFVLDSQGRTYGEGFLGFIGLYLNGLYDIKDPNGVRLTPDRFPFDIVHVKVPRQHDGINCGVFMLHFAQQILNSPNDFVKDIIDKVGTLDADKVSPFWKGQELETKREWLVHLFVRLEREDVKRREDYERYLKRQRITQDES
jgi:hypothetical protein